VDTWKQKIIGSNAYSHAIAIRDTLAGVNPAEISETERVYYERAEMLIDTVLRRLDNTDPRLVNISALTQLQTPLQNAFTYLNNWMQGSGESYLTTHVNTALDEALAYAVNLSLAEDVPEAREAVTSLRRSVARHNQVVESEIAKVIQKGTDADATIDEKIAAAQNEFQELEKNIDELDSDLKDIKTASAQVATEQQTAFTKAEADRSAVFNQLINNKQKELSDSIEKMSSNAKSTLSQVRINVQADEKAAEDAKTRIEEILGIVGEDALISDYAQTKREEQKAADLWRWITIGSLVIAVALAIWFAFTVDATTAWQKIVTKAFIVLSLGGIAGYAGKQSGEHRSAQRAAESMALQLKALKPYLYDLDDATKRDDLLVKIANRVFGQTPYESKLPKKQKAIIDESVPTPQLLDVILELIKKLESK
jgi:hypothetical protein